jgi:hypothetical protein
MKWLTGITDQSLKDNIKEVCMSNAKNEALYAA